MATFENESLARKVKFLINIQDYLTNCFFTFCVGKYQAEVAAVCMIFKEMTFLYVIAIHRCQNF